MSLRRDAVLQKGRANREFGKDVVYASLQALLFSWRRQPFMVARKALTALDEVASACAHGIPVPMGVQARLARQNDPYKRFGGATMARGGIGVDEA